MLSGTLISGLSAIVLLLALLTFVLLMRHRFVKVLPALLRQAAESILLSLQGIGEGGTSSIPVVSEAFKDLDYLPLQRRWNQCHRDFMVMGNKRFFFDVDEVFQVESFMDEALERRKAQMVERWILVGGALSFCVVTAMGLLSGNVAVRGGQDAYFVLGFAFAVLAVSFMISMTYRLQEELSLKASMAAYTQMVSRLKECLPPVGRNNLIQTLFLLQNEQSAMLNEHVAQMQKSLEDYATHTLSEQIGSRFDGAIQTYLAPPIQKMADTQDVLMHRLLVDQHKRLDQLFTLFTTQVGGLLSAQMEGMADKVSSASKGMQEITTALQSVTEAVSVTLGQNRETTSRNSALLVELSATHKRLMDRFSEATILLDDILTSSKILADTTTNANLSTIDLSEQAVRLQKETGEKFDLLRSTLDERLTASTAAALALQDGLASHAELVRTGLGDYSASVRESNNEFAASVRDSLSEYSTSVKDSLGGYSTSVCDSNGEYFTSVRDSLEKFSTDLQHSMGEQARLVAMQQKEQMEQTFLQSKEQAELSALQQRGQAELITLQQREMSELMMLQQREQSERVTLQQKELTEQLFGALFQDVRTMEENTMRTLQQAQSWSLEVSRGFSEEAHSLFDRISNQSQELSREIQTQGRSNSNMLILTNKTLTETAANQVIVLEEHSTKLLDAMKADAQRLVQSLHQESAGLLQILPTQMREAFDSFTAAMGETMRSTLADSVEIIDRLGEKTERLHGEFDMYFSRTEGNTDKLIEDLRFAMEGAIGKFTEMSDGSLNQLRQGNAEAMTAFADQTRTLMDAVDEQTRTLSLYIKDMGIDMGDLNKGLKSSVSEFSDHIRSGVENTFKEFDSGLAEIVQRMTELGISIEESVQALPETIGKLRAGQP